MYTLVNPNFIIYKWGLRGSKPYRRVFVMLSPSLINQLYYWSFQDICRISSSFICSILVCLFFFRFKRAVFIVISECHLTFPLFITKTRLYKYIEKVYNKKKDNFQIKNSDVFHISAQYIDCGYSLEPPRWSGSNEYTQFIFLWLNKKK